MSIDTTNPNSLGIAGYTLFQMLQHHSTVDFSFDKEKKKGGDREGKKMDEEGKGEEK